MGSGRVDEQEERGGRKRKRKSSGKSFDRAQLTH